jgi:hypothetical protein
MQGTVFTSGVTGNGANQNRSPLASLVPSMHALFKKTSLGAPAWGYLQGLYAGYKFFHLHNPNSCPDCRND